MSERIIWILSGIIEIFIPQSGRVFDTYVGLLTVSIEGQGKSENSVLIERDISAEI